MCRVFWLVWRLSRYVPVPSSFQKNCACCRTTFRRYYLVFYHLWWCSFGSWHFFRLSTFYRTSHGLIWKKACSINLRRFHYLWNSCNVIIIFQSSVIFLLSISQYNTWKWLANCSQVPPFKLRFHCQIHMHHSSCKSLHDQLLIYDLKAKTARKLSKKVGKNCLIVWEASLKPTIEWEKCILLRGNHFSVSLLDCQFKRTCLFYIFNAFEICCFCGSTHSAWFFAVFITNLFLRRDCCQKQWKLQTTRLFGSQAFTFQQITLKPYPVLEED